MPNTLCFSHTATAPILFEEISSNTSWKESVGDTFGIKSLLQISDTFNVNFFPNIPPGWKRAKSSLENPFNFNKQIAISDKQGESDLFFYHNRSAINTLSRTVSESRQTEPKEIKKIKTNTLNSVIEESPFKSKKINFVNIDVEGYEMNVLKGFDIEKYYPDVIVIEYLDVEMKKIEFYNQDIAKIMSSELYKFMNSKKYRFVNWLHSDLVFVSDNIRDI